MKIPEGLDIYLETAFNKDACMVLGKTEKGTMIVYVYIYDTLCVGNKEAIDEVKKEISDHSTNKDKGKMN